MFRSQTTTQISWSMTILAGSAFVVSLDAAQEAGKNSKASPSSQKSETDGEIRSIIARYARSIDDADTRIASQVWSDSPEASFIHPMGHGHGLPQIEQNFYKALMGDTFSERRLTIRNMSANVYGNSAWAEFDWDFEAKLRKDGSSITTHGRETQVYHKESRSWRLGHVHYSGMPIAAGRGF